MRTREEVLEAIRQLQEGLQSEYAASDPQTFAMLAATTDMLLWVVKDPRSTFAAMLSALKEVDAARRAYESHRRKGAN